MDLGISVVPQKNNSNIYKIETPVIGIPLYPWEWWSESKWNLNMEECISGFIKFTLKRYLDKRAFLNWYLNTSKILHKTDLMSREYEWASLILICMPKVYILNLEWRRVNNFFIGLMLKKNGIEFIFITCSINIMEVFIFKFIKKISSNLITF